MSAAEVEIDPAFAAWPARIEAVDDATALFAGIAPCVRREGGRVDCIDRGGTAETVGYRALRFGAVHGSSSEREALASEAERLRRRPRLRRAAGSTPLHAWAHHPTPFEPPPILDGLSTSYARVETHGGCAILEGGRAIVCWGSHGSEGEPLFVDLPGEIAVEVAISSEQSSLSCCYGQCLDGEPHACARLASGRVMCWGWSFVGQLGDGHRTTTFRHGERYRSPLLDAPVLVEGVTDATQIAVGMHHSCALRADRTVACWGYNLHGQLGDGADVSRPSPVAVIAVEDAVAISAGEEHSCAVLAGGRLACWGNEQAFGVSRAAEVPLPRLLDAPEPLVEVAAGDTYTCARAASGRVYCGGRY